MKKDAGTMFMVPKLLRKVKAGAALAVMAGLLAGAGAGLAHAQASYSEADYVGSWHLMFQGKAFATLTIQKQGTELSGSLTGVSIEMDDNGKLTNATANNGPASTLHAAMEDGVLHVSEKDGDDVIEWTMTLTSAKTGELRFARGVPANAEAIRLEKLWSEPPVQN
ncbi:hypothetical protein [Occallatibacter riparius]|uniref:Lipocalin-like domain-containing protein n=1 Tax=Occallatibacter riparius TaxID=1002689 RepID=A0A9J7BY15_9BACT|nr:hypothetical protein [Occallatibacter riparius]UWZ86213.1 hypothetical protein MOP44_09765 [Occallatibacter riparius]